MAIIQSEVSGQMRKLSKRVNDLLDDDKQGELLCYIEYLSINYEIVSMQNMQELNTDYIKFNGENLKIRILWDELENFVAESNGIKLGIFTLAENADDVLYIKDMQVTDEYRRHGIGTLMLNEIIKIYGDNVAKYYLEIDQHRHADHLSTEGAEFFNKYFK